MAKSRRKPSTKLERIAIQVSGPACSGKTVLLRAVQAFVKKEWASARIWGGEEGSIDGIPYETLVFEKDTAFKTAQVRPPRPALK